MAEAYLKTTTDAGKVSRGDTPLPAGEFDHANESLARRTQPMAGSAVAKHVLVEVCVVSGYESGGVKPGPKDWP